MFESSSDKTSLWKEELDKLLLHLLNEKLSSVRSLVCLYVSSPAVIAAEVVRMVRIVLENQRNVFNDGLTFLADVLPQTMSLLTVMTRTAQMSVGQKIIFAESEFKSHSCLHSMPCFL